MVLDVLGGYLVKAGMNSLLLPVLGAFLVKLLDLAEPDRDRAFLYIARTRRYFARSGIASANIALLRLIVSPIRRVHE